MNGDEDRSEKSRVVLLLTVAIVLTGAALAWLSWTVYESYRFTSSEMERGFRIERLRGEIIHLDEVLTMSARMAGATGDLRWDERYHRFEPQLDTAIKQAIDLEPNAGSGEAASQTDAANLKLVEMEERALDLIHQGRRDEAQAILFSDAYEEQKTIYAEGMTEFASLLQGTVDDVQQSRQRQAVSSIGITAVAMPILALAWLIVLRTTRRWQADLLHANRKLRERNRQLVNARTQAATDALTGLNNHRAFPDVARSADELLYGADVAMYQAKSAGKNRVGCWLPERAAVNDTGGAKPRVAPARR